MASEMLRPYLVDRGLDLADIGKLLGTAGFFAGLVGALAGGFLVTYVGRYRAIVWFGLLQAITVFSYYLLTQDILSNQSLYVICSLEIFCGSMATAAIFTAMMDVCEAAHGATDYTLQACAVVVAVGLAGVLAGFFAGAFGYALLFLVSVGLNLGGIGVFALRYRGQVRAAVISLET
jgi:MFS family permease